MQTLGSKVKQLRNATGLTLNELARAASTTEATLSRLEAGKMNQLKSEKLKSLATALRVSVDFLLGEDDLQKVEDIIARDTEAREMVSSYSQMDAASRKQLRDFAQFLTNK